MITIRQRKRPPAPVAAAAIRSAVGALVRFTAAAILLGAPTAPTVAPAVPSSPPGGTALPPHINSTGSTGSTPSS